MLAPPLTFLVADESDLPVFEGLAKNGMASFYALHKIEWKSEIFHDGFLKTQNYKIQRNDFNVGVLRISLESDHVYVHDLHVHPNVTSQGIGTGALAFVVSVAERANKNQIKLSAFKGNSAINLYQRMGFKIVGENDHLVKLEMSLHIQGKSTT